MLDSVHSNHLIAFRPPELETSGQKYFVEGGTLRNQSAVPRMPMRPPMRRRPSRTWVFRILTLLIGCLAAGVLTEFGLRMTNVWIGRHSDTMFTIVEYDENLGWKMRPSASSKIDFVDVEDLPIQSNSAGFWDKEFSRTKPSARYRIALLGDSFTWGMGVREEERFGNVLATLSPKLETLNFGMPGYGTDQSLLVWRNVASHYAPDMIVLTLYQNDYLDNMYDVRYGRHKPYFDIQQSGQLQLCNVPVPTATFWQTGIYNEIAQPYQQLLQISNEKRSRLAHWCAKHSDLARLSYTALRARQNCAVATTPLATIDSTTALDRSLTPEPLDSLILDVGQHAQVRLMSVLVDALRSEVEANGGRLLVVVAGHRTTQHIHEMDYLTACGVDFVDATTDTLATRVSRNEIYFPFNKHWTAVAHRAVAELILEQIESKSQLGLRHAPND